MNTVPWETQSAVSFAHSHTVVNNYWKCEFQQNNLVIQGDVIVNVDCEQILCFPDFGSK